MGELFKVKYSFLLKRRLNSITYWPKIYERAIYFTRKVSQEGQKLSQMVKTLSQIGTVNMVHNLLNESFSEVSDVQHLFT